MMTEKPKFAICLNCMDGRVQIPVINWIKDNCGVDYVDIITEMGMDGYLYDWNNPVNWILRKIGISVIKHDSGKLFIVGHHDCGGNPVDEVTHRKHIAGAVERMRKLLVRVEVRGLWVSPGWQVEEVSV